MRTLTLPRLILMLALAGLTFTGFLFATSAREAPPPPTPERRAVPIRAFPTPAIRDDEGSFFITENGPGFEDEVIPEDVEGWDFVMPLRPYTGVSDRYGAPRGQGWIHAGIDMTLEGRERSPVYAACPGQVVFTGFNGGYGNHVVIDCGDHWETVYAHLSEILVTAGDRATQEDVVGISGSTGFSTGEHLHFEIRYKGFPVNPEDYLDYGIPAGTPLSTGPIVIEGAADAPADQPGQEPTATTTPEAPPPSPTPIRTAPGGPPNPTSAPTTEPTPEPTAAATSTATG
ncbi:MAG: M23 family metallopeptidase [Dehalococcoidia bacterium]